MLRTIMTVIALGSALACGSTHAKHDRQETDAELERIRNRTNTGVTPGTGERPPLDTAIDRAKENTNQTKPK